MIASTSKWSLSTFYSPIHHRDRTFIRLVVRRFAETMLSDGRVGTRLLWDNLWLPQDMKYCVVLL